MAKTDYHILNVGSLYSILSSIKSKISTALAGKKNSGSSSINNATITTNHAKQTIKKIELDNNGNIVTGSDHTEWEDIDMPILKHHQYRGSVHDIPSLDFEYLGDGSFHYLTCSQDNSILGILAPIPEDLNPNVSNAASTVGKVLQRTNSLSQIQWMDKYPTYTASENKYHILTLVPTNVGETDVEPKWKKIIPYIKAFDISAEVVGTSGDVSLVLKNITNNATQDIAVEINNSASVRYCYLKVCLPNLEAREAYNLDIRLTLIGKNTVSSNKTMTVNFRNVDNTQELTDMWKVVLPDLNSTINLPDQGIEHRYTLRIFGKQCVILPQGSSYQ